MKSNLAKSPHKRPSKWIVVLLPLVALATSTPAKATTVYLDPNNNDTCNVTGASGSCVVMQAGSQPGGNSNLDWLQLSGDGSAQYSNGTYSLTFDANGGSDSNYLPAGPVPVSWDFTVAGSSAISWTVSFTLGLQQTSSSIYPNFMMSGIANPGDVISNIGAITFAGGGTPIFYDMSIELTSNSSFTADIPAGSTEDFNPVVGAPEPRSAALLAVGAVMLLLWRKRLASATSM